MNAPVPVLLLTATDPGLFEPAVAGIMVDLPDAVCLTYERDADQALHRRVSDWSGPVYDELIGDAAACVSCAVRTDLPVAAQFLAEQRRWSCVVAVAPATVAPQPLAHGMQQAISDDSAPDVALAPVVTFVGLDGFEHDLLGDDLLDERGLALKLSDRRSVGESLTAQLEYADVVVALNTPSSPRPEALLRAVCLESTALRTGWSTLDVVGLLAMRHDHEAARARVHPMTVPLVRPRGDTDVWTLDLATVRPLDPELLLQRIEELGGGKIRGKGYFWLASRPDVACVWDASGGQLSIGVYGGWEGRMPSTRLVVTGTDAEDRDRIEAAFPQVSLQEPSRAGGSWRGGQDGFESWLG